MITLEALDCLALCSPPLLLLSLLHLRVALVNLHKHVSNYCKQVTMSHTVQKHAHPFDYLSEWGYV